LLWQVLPRRYARALLTAIYLDVVDPACIMRSSVSLGTLSEVQAAVASRTHVTATDEAMELYHIGRFIDFPALAHGKIYSLPADLSLLVGLRYRLCKSKV